MQPGYFGYFDGGHLGQFCLHDNMRLKKKTSLIVFSVAGREFITIVHFVTKF